MRKVQESLDLNLDGEKPLLLNCEGVFLPIGSGHRNPSVFSVFWRVCGAPLSLPPSSVSLSTLCVSVARQSRAELSRAGRGGRSKRKVVVLNPVIHHCNCKVKKGRIPGVVCRQKCVCTNSELLRMPSHTSARALTHKRTTWPSKEQPQGDPAEKRK